MVEAEQIFKVHVDDATKEGLKKALEQVSNLMTAVLGDRMEAELSIGIKEFGGDDWEETFSYNPFQGYFIQDVN